MTTITKAIAWKAGQNIVRRGTPIDADGNIANNKTAIGIVIENVERPNSATVLTAGEWDEVTNYSGITLSDDCKRALANILLSARRASAARSARFPRLYLRMQRKKLR